MVTGDWRERERVAEKAVLGGTAGGTSLLILAAIIHLALIRPLRSSAGATERASERGFPFLQTGQTELLKEQHAFLLKASLLAPLPPPPPLRVCIR